jgi:hypothetical protein
MTESEFLDRQEARAREALADSAHRIETELCRAVPLEQTVRDHPVLSLGAGAAGGVATGFLLGKLLGPRGSGAVLSALGTLAWPAVRRFRSAAIEDLVAGFRETGTTRTPAASD